MFCATTPMQGQAGSDWRQIFAQRLPAYGHRNWIVVADSAYPSQTREGIETIVSQRGQIEVLKVVLDELAKSRHVVPVPWTDSELKYLNEEETPGITKYREELGALLKGRDSQSLAHEQILAKLDEVSRLYKVLVIKTTMGTPYTTVFLQLDCAYWTPAQDEKLRLRMKQTR
jgi:hypothetical protein